MGRSRRRLIILTIATVLPAAIWSSTVNAAPLESAADYLSRQQENISSGLSHHIFFTPATSMAGSGNVLRLVFPQSPVNTWCRVEGAGLSAIGITDPPGASEAAIPLPGTLSAECAVGDGVTTFDTITISHIGQLIGGTKYGLVVADPGSAKLGTPPAASGIPIIMATNNGATDMDSLQFYAAIIPADRLVVSAVVIDQNPIQPNPMVQFSGLAGSAAALTIIRGSTVVHSSTLGVNGQFDVTLADQPVGEQTYVVSAQDAGGRPFSSLTFVLNLQLNTTTALSDIFLGPTISVDASNSTLGQVLTFSGTTVPLSPVTLNISTVPTASYSTVATATGGWQVAVSTTDLGVGTFSAQARAVSNGATSSFGPSINLTVVPSSATNTNTTVPANSNTSPPLNTNQPTNTNPAINVNQPANTNAPVIRPPTEIAITDLNTDRKVDLIDFSILMFYWQQRQPANAAADINRDGIVDIVDVSIMFFRWTTPI